MNQEKDGGSGQSDTGNSLDPNQPITDFSQCHAGIFSKLDTLGELPELVEPAKRARDIAAQSLQFFREAIFKHHQDEEEELFPAVIRSAVKGEERDRVKAMVKQLTTEHRQLEAAWKRIESGLKTLVKGQIIDIDSTDINKLVSHYRLHAQFEEAEFLPLAETILGRDSNHMAALGISLHLRHNVKYIGGYV